MCKLCRQWWYNLTYGFLFVLCVAAAGTVVEFVGVRCHVNCGAHDTWPRVVRFKATIAALQVSVSVLL
jgi:hypothetical protein